MLDYKLEKKLRKLFKNGSGELQAVTRHPVGQRDQ